MSEMFYWNMLLKPYFYNKIDTRNWNSLPTKVTSFKCLRTFKKKIITLLFFSFFSQLTVKWLRCHRHFFYFKLHYILLYCIVVSIRSNGVRWVLDQWYEHDGSRRGTRKTLFGWWNRLVAEQYFDPMLPFCVVQGVIILVRLQPVHGTRRSANRILCRSHSAAAASCIYV